MAKRTGMFKSDHTFLDGSNVDEKDKVGREAATTASSSPACAARASRCASVPSVAQDTSTISKEDADKLFRYSDQA